MTTLAKIGHGTLFALLDDELSPPAYVPLAEVVSITPPALARDTVEATHTESEEKWREFIPGLKDAGEVTIEMNFIPGGETTERILAAFNSDEPSLCQITFPDTSPQTVWGFTAFVTGFEPEAATEDKMSASVTFKLTGKPSFV